MKEKQGEIEAGSTYSEKKCPFLHETGADLLQMIPFVSRRDSSMQQFARKKEHEQKQLFANQVFAMSNFVYGKCPKPKKKIWYQE